MATRRPLALLESRLIGELPDGDQIPAANVPGGVTGKALLALASPGAIRFVRINADGSVTLRADGDMRGDLGLGTMATQAAADYVTLATAQTVTGAKTFSGNATFTGQIFLDNEAAAFRFRTTGGVERATWRLSGTALIAEVNGATRVTMPAAGGFDVTGTGTFSGKISSTSGAGTNALQIAAAARFFLDGGSNTYIEESSNDIIGLVCGGVTRFNATTTGATVYGIAVADRYDTNSSNVYGVWNTSTAANAYLQLSSASSTYGYIGSGAALFNGGSSSHLAVRGESTVVFGVGTSDFARLLGNGNFLIGTATDSGEVLHVAGAISARTALLLTEVYQINAVTSASQTRTFDVANGSEQTISATHDFTLNATGPSGKACDAKLFVYNASAGAITVTVGTGYTPGLGNSVLNAGETAIFNRHWDGTRMWSNAVGIAFSGDLRPT